MKKHILILILISCFTLTMTSCSKDSTKSTTANNRPSTPANSSNNQESSNSNKTMLFGKVDSIIGNEVTLLVAKNSTSTQTKTSESQSQSQSKSQTKTQALGVGTTQDGGMGGQWSGQRNNSSSKQSFKLTYTGEKKNITIPVGVPILETKTVNEKKQQTEVDLSDIEEGSILTITMENNFITQVRIQGTESSQSSSQSTQNMPGDMGGGGAPAPGGN